LVVVAIIALLIALLLPTMAKAKDEAKLVRCGSNLHAIGLGIATYNAGNNGLMPHGKDAFSHPYSARYRADGSIIDYVICTWAESLFIDGCFRQNDNVKGIYGGSWHYFAQGFGIFKCPSHDPLPQAGDDSPQKQGYGIAWCVGSDFQFRTQLAALPDGESFPANTPKFRVYAKDLNPSHIMGADASAQLGRDGAQNSPLYTYVAAGQIYGPYGVFPRHTRGNSRGANYLFADNHVEWSDVYGNHPSPLNFTATRTWAAGQLRVWAHGASDR